MKSSSKIIAIVACVFSLAGNLYAQENSGGMVAVLDVAKVFEEDSQFNTRMDAIKDEAAQFKTYIEGQQSALQQRAAPLSEFKPGSPEFNQLQSELEQETAKLRTKAQQTNMELLNREAAIYHDTYIKMQSVVADIANNYNINLIIRFDSKAIDHDDRGEVIKGVNRNIVYQKDLDLTTMVIGEMAKNTPSSANAGGNLNR